MNVARSQPWQPSPYTLRIFFLKYVKMNYVLNLEIAFENAHADPNMLLLADRLRARNLSVFPHGLAHGSSHGSFHGSSQGNSHGSSHKPLDDYFNHTGATTRCRPYITRNANHCKHATESLITTFGD